MFKISHKSNMYQNLFGYFNFFLGLDYKFEFTILLDSSFALNS